MKIKIIDLLNLVYEDKLKERTLIKVNYGDKLCEYWRYINNKFVIFYDKGKTETTGCIDILSYLREKNITVEIIEEKEIEKIGKIYDGFTDSYYDTCLETTIKKVDEIIDVVNKLKKEKQEVDYDKSERINYL